MIALNWANRTMWTGVNLDIMRRMNSENAAPISLSPSNPNRNFTAQ